MKKALFSVMSIISLGLSMTAYADIPDQQFMTIAQAEQFCPPLNGLTFTASHPIPHSPGTITGSQNNIAFTSLTTALAPWASDSSGIIDNVQFRYVGLYGYISNNVITCLYSYPDYSGGLYALIMRSNS